MRISLSPERRATLGGKATVLPSIKPLHNIGEGRITGHGPTYRESDTNDKTIEH